MTTWNPLTTPWDAGGVSSAAICGCFAPGFGAGTGRLVVGGNGPSGASSFMTSDDGGASWTDRGFVFTFVRAMCFAPALGLVIAVGSGPLAAISADGGATWGAPFNPFAADEMFGVDCNTAGNLLVALDGAGGLWSSTDGTVWNSETSPLTRGTHVRFVAPLSKWFACGGSASEVLASAPAANVTAWTLISTPLDGGAANDVAYQLSASKLYVCAADGVSTTIASADGGATWATEANPFDPTGDTFALAEAGTAMLCAGDDFPTMTEDVMETDGSGVWVGETAIPAPNGGNGVFYVADLGLAFLLDNASNSGANQCVASAVFAPPPPPPPTIQYQRIYGIPIDISDNSVETVSQLLTSPDGFTP